MSGLLLTIGTGDKTLAEVIRQGWYLFGVDIIPVYEYGQQQVIASVRARTRRTGSPNSDNYH